MLKPIQEAIGLLRQNDLELQSHLLYPNFQDERKVGSLEK